MNNASIPNNAERTVLCISPKPDRFSIEGLAAAGWLVVHAKTAQQAERMLERNAIKVGLIDRLTQAGYDAFLIGETLMRQPDPAAALASLLDRAYAVEGMAE